MAQQRATGAGSCGSARPAATPAAATTATATTAARRLLPYGEGAVLVECPDLDDALGLMTALQRRRSESIHFESIDEIVPGARTLLLRLRRSLTTRERTELLRLEPADRAEDAPEEVEVRVAYDGADLIEVAELTGLSAEAVIATHTGQRWTVGFCGFAPGFAYLRGEHERLRVPRRRSPRSRVPAGSVGLADQWCGVYPRPGPGGWQLIGHTDLTIWDLRREPSALLHPGIVVRFVRD